MKEGREPGVEDTRGPLPATSHLQGETTIRIEPVPLSWFPQTQRVISTPSERPCTHAA